MHERSLPTFALALLVAACGADDSSDGASAARSGAGSSSMPSAGSSPSGSGGSPFAGAAGRHTGGNGGTSVATAGSGVGGAAVGGAGTGGTEVPGSAGTASGAGSGRAGSPPTAMGGMPSAGTGGAASGGVAGSPPPPVNGKADGTLVGFAAYPALGLKTTTGGDGGTVVKVTTIDELAMYASAPEPYVIQVQGTITTSDAKYRKLRVTSNKTIVGVGADATVEHIGFDVTGWWETEASTIADFCDAPYKDRFTHVSNVIIRNLHFKNTLGSSSDADGIVVQCYSHHVWIDHNTFHGVASGNDGAIDVKRGADWVTVSWNHIMAWDKSMLLGHVDSNEAQDRGALHVTYHHNYLENTRQRHPRVRFAHAHIFNNFLFNDASVPNRTASYFLVAGVEANVHADGNLVHHAKELYLVGEESDSGAKLTYTDTNKAVALVAGAEAPFHIQPNGMAFDPKDFYDYTLQPADELATILPQGAGAGKL